MLKRSRPLILAYNLWGKLAFNVSEKHLIQSPAIQSLVTSGNLYLCPLINFSKSDILSRAQRFETKIMSTLENINEDKIDIVAYSMAGLDLKVVLQENKNLADKVQNYVTVGTPHCGTLLSVIYNSNQLDSSHLEKSNLSTGVHYSDLMECNEENMQRLNDYLEPYDHIRYHSIAGDKAFQDQSKAYQRISKQLLESRINNGHIFNDGLFFEDEVRTDTNSITLNADHLELSPVSIMRDQDHYGHILKYLSSY